ncbi:uncharacterized protein A4U43_C09F10330 [Asparagus officinalis]|uniref:Uncharacterized protein n=1 Tax=Asparagus officinalis TaxID=4686 RepID=A0A5P1E6J4_ASPOF|nr:uncharacterized protein A4U43_C09F10330 [Asparagus officinalis]
MSATTTGYLNGDSEDWQADLRGIRRAMGQPVSGRGHHRGGKKRSCGTTSGQDSELAGDSTREVDGLRELRSGYAEASSQLPANGGLQEAGGRRRAVRVTEKLGGSSGVLGLCRAHGSVSGDAGQRPWAGGGGELGARSVSWAGEAAAAVVMGPGAFRRAEESEADEEVGGGSGLGGAGRRTLVGGEQGGGAADSGVVAVSVFG